MRTPGISEDRALVERLQAGDPGAVDELALRYGTVIFQLALRHVKNREDAEEVVQDVLLKAVRTIGAFRGDAALSSWLYRITFNTAMSRLRTLKFTRPAEIPEHALTTSDGQSPLRGLEPADRSALPDEGYLRSQMRLTLWQALSSLPPIYRRPVLLRDVRGLTTEEASAALDIKAQTLKSRLHRGRVALRERLAHFGDGLSLHPAT